MRRLEIIEELKVLEEKKITLESMKHDGFDYFTDGISLKIYLDTRLMENKKKYRQETFRVNGSLFKAYLNAELENNELEIKKLVEKLK